MSFLCLVDSLQNVDFGYLFVLYWSLKSLLALVNVGFLINKIVWFVLKFLYLCVSLGSHQQCCFPFVFILILQSSWFLSVPIDLLQTHLHISLSPHLSKLVKFIYLGVLNLYCAVMACPLFILLLTTICTACPWAHPTMVFACQKSQLFVAKLAIFFILRRANLACLCLDQRVECINYNTSLEIRLAILHKVRNSIRNFIKEAWGSVLANLWDIVKGYISYHIDLGLLILISV